ncbi:MAG: hypothetical protein L6Q84_19395 [Polyangiaceae bacterium]|nr:hypothetical protein [Polyangiaceae bacterium]
MQTARRISASLAVVVLSASVVSCGGGKDDEKYQPRAAASGAKAQLPAVPNVPQKPIKAGDAYTVWGASYHLRSRTHRKEVAGKKLSITGYIGKTNLPDAPACAVHKGGKADPEGCNAPVPAFWLCDTKDAPENECIKVMGWASNFAGIYDAVKEFEKKEDAEKSDTFWGVKMPNPIPNKGAKVTVKGDYSTTFVRATTGTEADPIMGILTFEELTYHEKPAELAFLPGMDPPKEPPKKK